MVYPPHFARVDTDVQAKITGPDEVYVKKGSTISLTCIVDVQDIPPNNVTWYHAGAVIDFDGPRCVLFSTPTFQRKTPLSLVSFILFFVPASRTPRRANAKKPTSQRPPRKDARRFFIRISYQFGPAVHVCLLPVDSFLAVSDVEGINGLSREQTSPKSLITFLRSTGAAFLWKPRKVRTARPASC